MPNAVNGSFHLVKSFEIIQNRIERLFANNTSASNDDERCNQKSFLDFVQLFQSPLVLVLTFLQVRLVFKFVAITIAGHYIFNPQAFYSAKDQVFVLPTEIVAA